MGPNCTAALPCAAGDVQQPFLPDEPERSTVATPVRASEYGNPDAGRFFGFAEAGDRVGFGQGPFGDYYQKSGAGPPRHAALFLPSGGPVLMISFARVRGRADGG
jgi:hypothetical protein